MTERYVSCNKQEDIVLRGVQLQIIDNKIEAIVVSDEDGNSIRIVNSGNYTNTLKVLKPEPLSQRQVWVITGKLFGLAEFNEEKFTDDYAANARLSQIKDETCCWSDNKLGLNIEIRSEFYTETKIN